MIHNKILKLIKEHEINLFEENLLLAFKDGFVRVTLDDGELKIEIEFIDRVEIINQSLDNFLEINQKGEM